VEIHQRLYREWPRLVQLYRGQLDEITSPERWERTFAASTGPGDGDG
jgi:galactofuranosylgalactofuranosylrhamnosyl-N-acetylglucosaminyl-diphospho-decaprenol beta-1,5/1,6-galactofuranosyltransferase